MQSNLEQTLQQAGGVSSNIVDAFRAVLEDSSLDGAFVSAAITLPASTELRDDLPNSDPVLLYEVRYRVHWSRFQKPLLCDLSNLVDAFVALQQ